MSDWDTYGRIAASLSEAALDDSRWPATSALLDEGCGAVGNIVTYGYGSTFDDVQMLFAQVLYRGERREDVERAYFEDYYPRDERVPRLRTLPESQVVHCRDTYSEEELKTSATYHEMLPRGGFQNSVNVRLDGPYGTRITWGIGDPAAGGDWSCARIDMIRRIVPHLRQYVGVRQALVDAQVLGTTVAGLLDVGKIGVIQLDGRGQIVAVNDLARAVLRRGDGLRDERGALHAWSPADDEGFQTVLARALGHFETQGAGGAMALVRPSLRPRLVVHVSPVGRAKLEFRPWGVAALVLIVDPARRIRVDPALVAAALDLTPAETHVAIMLADGKTVREVAAATGRKESTVRWHMLHIFSKNRIKRQVDLVRQVLSLAGLPWPRR